MPVPEAVEGAVESQLKTPFGTMSLVAPAGDELGQVVTKHLGAWLGCDATEYITTVGGFIYQRLGGSTTNDALRSGLETRYPGNPMQSLVVTAVSGVETGRATVSYTATHLNGLQVSRQLHASKETGTWKINRVSMQR